MKLLLKACVAFAAVTSVVTADCAQENGNWYCNPVQAISYSNFGTAGQYDDITYMQNDVCRSTPKSYGGGMAPMDGEISWHFRGPMHLKQFAYYLPGQASSKRVRKNVGHLRRSANHNAINHDIVESEDVNVEKKRDSNDWVTATINGQVVSWANNYSPAAAPTANPGKPSWVTATINGKVVSWVNSGSSSPTSPAVQALNVAGTTRSTSCTTTSTPATSTPPSSTSGSSNMASSSSSGSSPAATMNAGAGRWGRQGYYNAQQGIADGLVFLNHMGGQGSGVFDYTWGNSLSYASSDAQSGSASPVILADTLLADNTEIVVMTDNVCKSDSCGTVRPGTVAYHGFGGPTKLFLLEFDMPLTGKTGFNMDMPAAWILNAAIPRTMQYGPAECSCWISGCGEWDIFEVLDSGNTKTKSTWHGAHSLGDSNWFPRPTTKTQKAAVIFDGTSSTGHIILLPDDTTFDAALDDSVVANFLNSITSPSENIVDVLPS